MKKLNTDPNFILECEVFSEIAAGILYDFACKLEEKGIGDTDEDNPLIILYKKAIKLKHAIIRTANTFEELNEIKIKLKFIDEFIKEI